MAQTHYEVLGLARIATAAEIRRAHRRLARSLHPDVNASPDAAQRFARVQEAYDVLSDAAKRRAYDAKLSAAELPEPSTGPHYDFRNIADPGRKRGKGESGGGDAGDPTGFDELYEAFFAPRLRQQQPEKARAPRRKS